MITIVEFEHGLTDNVKIKDENETPGTVIGMTITNIGRSYWVGHTDGESHWYDEEEIKSENAH